MGVGLFNTTLGGLSPTPENETVPGWGEILPKAHLKSQAKSKMNLSDI